jgi:anti-anti-sigma regulatory factor
MTARNKKKGSTLKMSQETENTIMEGMVMATEIAQEQFVVSDGGLSVDDTGGLFESVSNLEILATDSSEVDMKASADFPEDQATDEAATEDVVASAINLDATLSIQNVVKLYGILKKSYAANDSIEIDASHVTSIDTATLQLFVALKKDAVKQKRSCFFSAIPALY